MVDNIAVTPGSGASVAADDIGGNLHQRVKLSLGADGSATDALDGAGNVASGVQRVTLATNDAAIAALIAALAGVANDASASAVDPVLTGLYAHLTQPTPVSASTDAVRSFGDADGATVIRHNTNLESIVTGNQYNTDGTSTQCIPASGDAAIKTYLQTIILTNMSATGIYVEIKDGSSVKLTIPLPASGGAVVNLPVPIPGTANTAWNFDPSAAVTTVYCSMVGFKSKV